jgi:hypothetical protein
MSTRVFLPEVLEDWVSGQFGLSDIQAIHFRLCRRIPFSWLLGRKLIGLTLWNRIYLLEDHWLSAQLPRGSVELVVHELVHVMQYRRNPLLFPLRYAIDHFRYGYDNNPAEVEARQIAARITESFFHSARL